MGNGLWLPKWCLDHLGRQTQLRKRIRSDKYQEWHNQLRSSLHPALFAAVYYVLDKPMEYLGFYPQFRAMVLTFAPSLVQSLFAAATDYFTWTLAKKIWGEESRIAWAAVSTAVVRTEARPNLYSFS